MDTFQTTHDTNSMVLLRYLFPFWWCFNCFSVGQKRKIIVRYGYFNQARPSHAACGRGWFDLATENTDYEVICYPQSSGSVAIAKLDDELLDIANLGSTPWALACARGVPIKTVYMQAFLGESQGIYVRPSEAGYRGIRTPLDMKGRTVAVPFGSTIHYQILFLIELLGLVDQVILVTMSPAEIVASWTARRIDGAGCWGVTCDQLLSSDIPARLLLSGSVLSDWGRPTFLVTAARAAFVSEHPSFLEHFVGILSRLTDSFVDQLGASDPQNSVRWNLDSPFVASIADSLMNYDETPGTPSADLLVSTRRYLDTFVHVPAEEQIECDFLGSDPLTCNNSSILSAETEKTADFLFEQKLLNSPTRFSEATFVDGSFLSKAQRKCENCFPAGPYFPILASSRENGADDLLGILENLDSISNKSWFPDFELGRYGGDTTCTSLSFVNATTGVSSSFGDGATGENGKIYSANRNCLWFFRASDCLDPDDACNRFVQLTFDSIRLWSGDFIRVFEDPTLFCNSSSSASQILLGQISGIFFESEHAFRSKGCLILELETDSIQERIYGDNTGSGIRVTYDLDSTGCVNDEECGKGLCVRGVCECDVQYTGSNCEFNHCIGTTRLELSEGDSQLIISNALEYRNNVDCWFVVKIPFGFHLQAEITGSLEEGFDLLHLGTGFHASTVATIYATLTGEIDVVTFIPTRDGYATLRMTTDAIGRNSGFRARLSPQKAMTTVSCAPGTSGTNCEFPSCTQIGRVAETLSLSKSKHALGRIVSQAADGNLGVPAMPWAPRGGCVWSLPNSFQTGSVGLRLVFNVPLDLEPQAPLQPRDYLEIETQVDGLSKKIHLFSQHCLSNIECSFSWQTGVCEKGSCTVQASLDIESSGSESYVRLITDRNDGHGLYFGVDFDAFVVIQCSGSCKSAGGSCRDGGCYCEGDVPCSCSCEDELRISDSRALKLSISIAAVLLLILCAFFLSYRQKKIRKSRIQKAALAEKDAELNRFRNSIVGICVATRDFCPEIAGDVDDVVWCWKESERNMYKHKPAVIWGNPKDCWVRYSSETSSAMEAAYQVQGYTGRFTPIDGYEVDFSKMIQTNTSTDFEREVLRINKEFHISNECALSLPKISDDEGEPAMVLCKGDIIQISKKREDGIAYGMKLFHQAEVKTRQLVQEAAQHNSTNSSSALLADTGWFPLEFTQPPSSEELQVLKNEVGGNVELSSPQHWTIVANPSLFETVTLDVFSNEYRSVEHSFRLSQPTSARITSIQRVQNLALWQSYVVKRKAICSREIRLDGSASETETMKRIERCWLWHGTSESVVDKILQQGFNRSFCGKNATAYGKGVYFARDSSFAARTMYALPDTTGKQHVLACRVVVGEYCPGTLDALTPDVRDPATHLLYDSTIGLLASDSVDDPSIYVTYHDAQAYPEYLLTFEQPSTVATA